MICGYDGGCVLQVRLATDKQRLLGGVGNERIGVVVKGRVGKIAFFPTLGIFTNYINT